MLPLPLGSLRTPEDGQANTPSSEERGFEWFCALRESIVKWDLVVSEVSIRALGIGGGESVWKRYLLSSGQFSEPGGDEGWKRRMWTLGGKGDSGPGARLGKGLAGVGEPRSVLGGDRIVGWCRDPQLLAPSHLFQGSR